MKREPIPEQQEPKKEVIQEKEKTVKKTKFSFETLYATILFTLCITCPIYINNIIDFDRYCSSQKGCVPLGAMFIFYSLLAAIVLFSLKYFVRFLTYQWFYKNIRTMYIGKDRIDRVKKTCKWTYDIIYYTIMTVLSIYFFKDSSWFPFQYGNKSKDYLDLDWPNRFGGKESSLVILYYIVQNGNHLYSLIELIFIRRKDEEKFFEWCLHHFVAVTLIVYSGYMNFFIFGVSVLMIHDFADVVIAWFKLYSELQNKKEVVFYINVVNMEVVWLLTRLYLFPTRVISPSFEYFRKNDGQVWDIASNIYVYMQGLMCVLYFMHVYWFGIMINLTYKQLSKIFKVKGKVEFHNSFDFREKPVDSKIN